VVVTDFWSSRGNQTGQSVDQLARLVEVCLLILGQSALDGSSTHEVDCGSGDYLYGWYLGDISG
jgi:hypothetical protein